jgi:NAD-reducing hydrogenase large subunit
MSQRIVIDPVTRIEGHAKISIFLDDAGNVTDAEFHVVEFRGFEKFCEGRPFAEMPGITPRICGICPVSHLLAAAKAGDAIMAVNIPPTADKLRRLMNLGQLVQSHALSFFPSERARFSARLGDAATATQRVWFDCLEQRSRPRRHPLAPVRSGNHRNSRRPKSASAWAVPGGVRSPLSPEGRERIRLWLPEALRHHRSRARAVQARTMETHQREVQIFGNFPSLFMGLIAEDGTWEHHGGKLRFKDSSGRIIADQLDRKSILKSSANPCSRVRI